MKRLLLLLLAYAVCGAIINVAVAWGCEVFPTGRFGRSDWLNYERDDDGQVVYTYLRAHEAGWPLRALSCGRHEEGLTLSFDPLYKLGIKGKDTLPIRPLPAGFAINTICYAAFLWLLFAAPGWVRRRIRARRGQCPACAYPVGSSDVCTECGAVLPLPKGEGRGEGEARDSKDAQRS